MTTQVVVGLLATNRGYIPLSSTITDAADSQEVQTNSTYTNTSQSIGTYAEGQVLQGGFVTAKTQCMYAFVLRNGVNISNITAIGSRTANIQTKIAAVTNPVTFQAGDQIVVRTEV